MPKKLPEVLTRVEEKLLLDQFNTRHYTSHRNMLMIKLALQTGMRVSELIKLKFRDITPSDGVFKIHIKQAKGGKDRMIYISPEIYDELYELHLKHDFPSTLVFPTLKKKPVQDCYLRSMIKRKGMAAGVPRVHFHLLRHTYLTRVYEKTHDIRVTQQIAGHSHISTTMIYTHISNDDVKNAMVKEK